MSSEVARLMQSLHCDDPAGRRAAAERLAQLGSDAQAAAVPLVEACATGDDELLEFASAALEELGPPMPGDAARLSALVASPSVDVAYWAATLLGRLKDHAASAVESLSAALATHPEGSVRERAAWALGQIGPAAAAARPALEKAAAGSNARLARLAREALAELAG